MGWLTMKSLDGHDGPRSYLDAQFTPGLFNALY
jgi:hypothetical protein